MEQLQHFSHEHPLRLVDLQPKHSHKDSDDEDGDDFVVEDSHGGSCHMCKEQIYSFHRFYYECKDCAHSLHKFCAELPTILQNHHSHPAHNLTLSEEHPESDSDSGSHSGSGSGTGSGSESDSDSDFEWMCDVCHRKWGKFFQYHCSICSFDMDIICATMAGQTMDHPSHPHQLQRMFKPMVSLCHACGNEHKGSFYHCTTCSQFWIHQDCALLPRQLLIEHATSGNFSHSHPLTLAYSFPYHDKEAKFNPNCRVCADGFFDCLWLYKCDKCRYYVHVDCATSKKESFLSILLPAGLGKTVKNFRDEDYPNLLNCPFLDESNSLLKHHFLDKKDSIDKGNDGEMLNHSSHQHPLVLLDTETSLDDKPLYLHNPMKKIQLLCDGCMKPITAAPFYKCSRESRICGFVLHDWCARLPSEIQDYPGHPEHTLVLLPNIPSKSFGVFKCNICELPSNGFAYGCTLCEYFVDINCGFIPRNITHDAHPNHLLSRINASAKLSKRYCNSCHFLMKQPLGFHCPSCDFYLHIECAFLLPKMTRHKYDKHPLSLRYFPVENHISEYFCEICEEEFNPEEWFYHCTTCVQSMHPACAPLILQSEQAVYSEYERCVFEFINVKFGRTLQVEGHPHHLGFVQGIEGDGRCIQCRKKLRSKMIFKCLQCEFAIHHGCVSSFNS